MTDENDAVPEPVAEQAQVVDVLVELTELLNTLPSNKERMQVLSCACLINRHAPRGGAPDATPKGVVMAKCETCGGLGILFVSDPRVDPGIIRCTKCNQFKSTAKAVEYLKEALEQRNELEKIILELCDGCLRRASEIKYVSGSDDADSKWLEKAINDVFNRYTFDHTWQRVDPK